MQIDCPWPDSYENDVSEINSTPELGGLRSRIPPDTLSQGEEVQQR